MSTPPITHPTTGQLLRFGPMHRRLEYPFLYGTAPAWLHSTGTFTQDELKTNYGFGRYVSATTSGSRAEVRTGFAVAPHTYTAMMLSVEGMRLGTELSATDWVLGLENDARTQGFAVQQLSGETKAQIVVHATGQKSDINYLFWGDSTTRIQRRNLSILHLQKEQIVFVLDRGKVIGWANTPGVGSDQFCVPRMFATTRVEGSAVTVQIGKFSLDLWH